MNYTVKAHPTEFKGVMFRSRLEARWAGFFDLLEIKWEYEPIDFNGWSPDFKIYLPCGHSECPDTHDLYAEVKPYTTVEQFKGHPSWSDDWNGATWDTTLLLGLTPRVSQFQISHGSGGGTYSLYDWDFGALRLERAWIMAGNLTQWCGNRRLPV